MNHIFSTKRGFTLIEMIVAIAIFSVVMTISTTAIFSVVNASRSSQALKSVMDNLNSALDTMGRSIRFGSAYHCENIPGVNGSSDITPSGTSLRAPLSCATTGGNVLIFEGHDGDPNNDTDQVVYQFRMDQPAAPTPAGTLWRCFAMASCVPLTAPEVHITDFKFYVTGAGKETGAGAQPMVVMLIKGYALAGTKQQTFELQTIVSQRNLEVYL